MVSTYWVPFVELVSTPFEHVTLVWGIVPLDFGLLLNERTSAKASFRTAVQTGFSFLWAGAQWLYPYFHSDASRGNRLDIGAMLPVNLFVTVLIILLGGVALISGLRRRIQVLRVPRLHAHRELFHDHDLPDPGAAVALDQGLPGHIASSRCGLAGIALQLEAFAKK